jgi:hypothetical protein
MMKLRQLMDEDRELDHKATFDDPVWIVVINDRLAPYIPYARRWWSEIAELAPTDTGIYAIDYDEAQPPGMMYRFTRTAIRSPIRGVQAFPFIRAGSLQITGVKGGSTKLIQSICLDGKFKIDEFTIVEIHNLPSTFNQGQLLAFVPTEILEGTKELGRWLYFTQDEISLLMQGNTCNAIIRKAMLKG